MTALLVLIREDALLYFCQKLRHLCCLFVSTSAMSKNANTNNTNAIHPKTYSHDVAAMMHMPINASARIRHVMLPTRLLNVFLT